MAASEQLLGPGLAIALLISTSRSTTFLGGNSKVPTPPRRSCTSQKVTEMNMQRKRSGGMKGQGEDVIEGYPSVRPPSLDTHIMDEPKNACKLFFAYIRYFLYAPSYITESSIVSLPRFEPPTKGGTL